MKPMKRLLALMAFGLAAGVAMGQTNNQISLGVSAGLYFPTGSEIRDAFGDSIFTIGLTPVASSRPTAGQLTPSVSIIGADKDGSNFLLVPITLGYEMHFGNPYKDQVLPFARIEGGLAYYNYAVNVPGGRSSGSEVGLVGDAELGLQISKSITISAKYYLFQEEGGLNFNGLELGLTFALFPL